MNQPRPTDEYPSTSAGICNTPKPKPIIQDTEGNTALKTMYLDHHATTPLDPLVLEAMMPYFTEDFGNPASQAHAWGWRAKAAVELARKKVATVLSASPEEVFFTSGATESNNLAIQGVAKNYQSKGRHFITTPIEHSCVLESYLELRNQGAEVTILPVDSQGLIDLAALRQAIRPDTILVSIIFGNNEIGTIQPIAEIGRICKQNDVLFHTDAVQAYTRVPIDVNALGIDLLSCSAHKIYGPKGTGVLYVRRKDPRVQLSPLFFGGSQEKKIRPGTLNVPGIVGMGAASELAVQRMQQEAQTYSDWREKLTALLRTSLGDRFQLNGHPSQRLAHNFHITLKGVPADQIRCSFPTIAFSSGSACHEGKGPGSHVLEAIGMPREDQGCSFRFGFGRTNQWSDVKEVFETIIQEVINGNYHSKSNA